jgi:hypothetical protein
LFQTPREDNVIVFDFDEVLTYNPVFVNSECRSDGLAFNVLRKLKKPTYIILTERNESMSLFFLIFFDGHKSIKSIA